MKTHQYAILHLFETLRSIYAAIKYPTLNANMNVCTSGPLDQQSPHHRVVKTHAHELETDASEYAQAEPHWVHRPPTVNNFVNCAL